MLTIGVVGDVMLDVSLHGHGTQASPECESIPVVTGDGCTYNLGGAANVAEILATAGYEVVLWGLVGDDWGAGHIRTLCDRLNIETQFMVDPGRPTTLKFRSFDGDHQVARMDVQVNDPGPWCMPEPGYLDALILSDYDGGVFHMGHEKEVQHLMDYTMCPVIVDCKPTEYMGSFKGADLIAPNKSEAQAMGSMLGMAYEDMGSLTHDLRAWFEADILAITLGDKGTVGACDDGEYEFFPIGCDDPQVIGAGDAFMVGSVEPLVEGRDDPTTMCLANKFAGEYVTMPRYGYKID